MWTAYTPSPPPTAVSRAKRTKKTENDIFGGEDFRVESVGGRWRHQPAAPGADADADAPSIPFALHFFCIFFTCADADVDAHADADADAPSIPHGALAEL